MKQWVSFVAILLVAMAANADVYKCKTAKGIVYSEEPCDDDAASTVKSGREPSAAAADEARARTARESNLAGQYQPPPERVRQYQAPASAGPRLITNGPATMDGPSTSNGPSSSNGPATTNGPVSRW